MTHRTNRDRACGVATACAIVFILVFIWAGIWVRSSDGADCPPGGT